jgi:hypothetical protein
MSRAERRHETERIKAKTRQRGLTQLHMKPEEITPRWVGKSAAMHWTCMCCMCKAPIKHAKPDFDRINPDKVYQ